VTHIAREVVSAALSNTPPPFLRKTNPRGRKRQGVKYEAIGQKLLSTRFGAAYTPSPWVRFSDASGDHWCQPDGLLDTNQGVIIVEFKYQHTIDAWHQLRLLYEPVLSVLLPDKHISVLEIVKWFDCNVSFPEPVRLVSDPEFHSGREFGVHIWKP
jgi:hypothetical protein